MSDTKPDQIFFAWTAYQRRAESMQPHFGYALTHLPPPFQSRHLKPFGYVIQSVRMIRAILTHKPSHVWIQLPPTFLLHVLFVLRLLVRGRFRIIADCHNATFRAPWSRLPGVINLLNACSLVIVHNAEIAQTAIGMGVNRDKLFTLEDPPANVMPKSDSAPASADTVLVPCSFNPDEPIAELMAAARLVPEIQFFVTGSLKKAEVNGYLRNPPANITWTGFVPKAEYDRMVTESAVILGLTTIEGIQLSVASEAIGAGKPLVLSDTRILREMFGAAALFTPNSADGIASACAEGIAMKGELADRSAALCASRWQAWHRAADRAMNLV